MQSREGTFHTVLPPHTVYLTPDRVSLKLFWGIRVLRNFFSNYQKLIDQKYVDSLEPQRGTAGGRGEGGKALDSGSQPGPPTWRMSWAVMALKGLRVIDDVRSFSFFFFNSKAVVTRTKQRCNIIRSAEPDHQETLQSQRVDSLWE